MITQCSLTTMLDTCAIKVFLTIIVSSMLITGSHSKRKDDKLILSPVELIDLVREEKNRRTGLDRSPKYIEFTKGTTEHLDAEDDVDTTECEDAMSLKSRKVWSRWSKWGDCSVTCGGGSVARRRVCVGGRCAHGELQEQRRPCARTPCLPASDDLADDVREAE